MKYCHNHAKKPTVMAILLWLETIVFLVDFVSLTTWVSAANAADTATTVGLTTTVLRVHYHGASSKTLPYVLVKLPM